MLKYILLHLSFIMVTVYSFSQKGINQTGKDSVFKKISVQKNLSYDAAQQSFKRKYFLFDFYSSSNPSTKKQPLIIWMHGGGFKFGSKNAKEIKIWGNEFAKQGFAFAAINYRLSKKNTLRNFKNLVEACYNNVDDLSKAIQFFKANNSQFNIDTNRIIAGGNSAGGIIALQAVYSNATDIPNVIDSNKNISSTGNFNAEHIAAVINFWGAIFNDAWLQRAKVPIVSVHGRKDRTVPATTNGVAFFGSIDIRKKAEALHIPNAIKVYDNYAHELQKHFNPFFRSHATVKRWEEAAQFAIDFLDTNRLNNILPD